MVDSRPRGERIPNANNPRLLVRLLTLVASGLRRPKALAEVAGVGTTKAQNVIKRALAEGLVHQTDGGLVNLAIKEWTVLGRAQW